MKKSLNYTVVSKLNSFLEMEKQKKEQKLGRSILVSEIEQEVATYCGVKKDAIYCIKRGTSNPSLPLALKIAEYFDVRFDQMFEIYNLENDEAKIEMENESLFLV